MKPLRLFTLVVCLAFASRAHGDIYRWDNGQVISGTEGITPGPGVQLDHRELSYANLKSAQLTQANFEASNLANANLTFATLTGATFTDAVVSGAHFNLFEETHGFTESQLYSTASYKMHDLRAINLSGNDMAGWDFNGQDLSGASFFHGPDCCNADLNGANFANANLTGVRMQNADVTNADFTGAIVNYTEFMGTQLTLDQLYATISYQLHNLEGINLEYVDLTNANLRGQYLANADLGQSPSGWFTNADLTGADLRGVLWVDLTATITDNLIRPEGNVIGLNLLAGEVLLVRDDDGVAVPSPADWVEPRPSIAIMIQEGMSIADSGVLQFIFQSDPWDSLISFEPNIPVQLGGTLDLTFANDVDVATQIGRSLHIFDWTGVSPVGQFRVTSPLDWDLSNLYTTGEIRLVSVPEPSSLLLLTIGVFGFLRMRSVR